MEFQIFEAILYIKTRYNISTPYRTSCSNSGIASFHELPNVCMTQLATTLHPQHVGRHDDSLPIESPSKAKKVIESIIRLEERLVVWSIPVEVS